MMQKEQKIIKMQFSKEFIEILRLLKVIDEYQAFFHLNNKGMQYSMLDPSHVQLLLVDFKGMYENIEECKFGIRIGDFLNIISSEDLKNMNNLTLEIDLANKKMRMLTNTINIEGDLIYTEGSDEFAFLPEPKLDAEVEAEIDLKNLLNAIKGFEEAKLTIENGRLFVYTENENIKKKTFIPSKLSSKDGVCSVYSNHYLGEFLKRAVRLTKSAKLLFANEKPLNIKFETKIAKISYWLAPRVE